MTYLIFLALGAMILGLGLLLGFNAKTGPQSTMGTALAFLGAVVLLFLLAMMIPAVARDLGQWENGDPAVREWYQHLMQPDHPTSPCCGEADAYWADDIHVRDGKTFAVVTDDRDDGPLKRPHIPNGTEIEVPDYKLKWDKGNPTGHGVLFMSYSKHVFCYVQPGGV